MCGEGAGGSPEQGRDLRHRAELLTPRNVASSAERQRELWTALEQGYWGIPGTLPYYFVARNWVCRGNSPPWNQDSLLFGVAPCQPECVFHLMRNCQTTFQWGCTILHSHQQFMRVLVVLHATHTSDCQFLTVKVLWFKGQHQESEKITYRMGEKIFKLYIWYVSSDQMCKLLL